MPPRETDLYVPIKGRYQYTVAFRLPHSVHFK